VGGTAMLVPRRNADMDSHCWGSPRTVSKLRIRMSKVVPRLELNKRGVTEVRNVPSWAPRGILVW
jgi:hypothetical protein